MMSGANVAEKSGRDITLQSTGFGVDLRSWARLNSCRDSTWPVESLEKVPVSFIFMKDDMSAVYSCWRDDTTGSTLSCVCRHPTKYSSRAGVNPLSRVWDILPHI